MNRVFIPAILRCRFFLVIGLLLLSAAAAVQAQTTQTYSYQNATFAWDAPSGGATNTVWDSTNSYCSHYPNSPNSGLPGDDVKADVTFPGGFTFTFAGTTYSSVRIMSNGIVQFGTDAGFHRDYTYAALPITAAAGFPGGGTMTGCANAVPTNLMLLYWQDIDAARNAGTSRVTYELLGTAPNRRFVITWNSAYLYGSGTSYNFQIVLYEGGSAICTASAPGNAACNNGEFEYRYTTGSSTGTGATVGVQLTTTDYTQYSSNQAFIDTVNGTNIHWYPAPPAAQVAMAAEYRFDESTWAGTQNEIVDTSGSGRNGVHLGGANTSNTQFKICRAALIPNNTSNATIDAAALGNPTTGTGYAPGGVGSVSFWYRPSASGSDAMLLDATATANRPFYIMRVGASNFIKLALSDTAGTVVAATSNTTTAVANTWIHVAASWKVAAGTNATIIQIFINGTLNTVVRGTTNGSLAALATPAYAGDNRTSGVTPSGGTGNSANGYLDEMRFYATEIGPAQARSDYLQSRASCSILDHFDITINGVTGPSTTTVSALTCEQVGVSIVARDSSNNAVTIASSATLSTSTNHGDWTAVSGGGASSFTNNGNGGATFTFNNTSTATFQLNDRWQETVSLNIVSGTIGVRAAADPSLVLTHEGLRFVVFDTPSSSWVVATPSALQGSSCTDQTIYVQSMKTDQSTFSCVANTGTSGRMGSFRNGGKPTISLAMQCVDPTACLTTGTAIATGVDVGTHVNATTYNVPQGSNSATAPAVANYVDLPLAAVTNNNAVASFGFRYRDSGKIRLYASYNYQDANGRTSTVVGQSPDFPVGPAGFAFCNVKNGGGVANPGATTLAGTLFAHAGETFTTDVWALACGASSSVCGGYANAAACVTANDCAGNFGQENVTPPINNKHGGGSFSLGGTLVAPATGHMVAPAFPSVSGVPQLPSFNSGLATGVQLYWNEVGAMAPALNLDGFFGSTLTYSGGGTTVGRFAPYQFALTLTPGCSTATAFTYSAQPFTGTITAQAKDGTTTQNYDNANARAFARTVTVSDTSGAAGSFSNNTRADTDFNAGVATFPLASVASPISWAFTAPPKAPVTLTLVARDTEQAIDVASNFVIRSGRVRMENAFGSELLSLPMRLVAEYYGAGGGWIQNIDDGCQAITRATDIAYSNWTRNLALADFSASDPISRLWSPLRAGNAGLLLKAPGSGNNGSVTMTVTVPAYLRINGANPSATATFGTNKGYGPQIFMRENY